MNKRSNRRNQRKKRRNPPISTRAGNRRSVVSTTGPEGLPKWRTTPYVVSIPKNCAPVPDRLQCWFRYNDTFSLSGAASIDQVFRGNSLFDFDLTGTGHQPTFFDQLSLLYGRYTVFEVELRCEFVWLATGLSGCARIAVLANNSSTALTSNESEAQQSPFAVNDISIANQKNYISTSYTSSEILGCKKIKIRDDDTFSALTTASPANIWYIHVVSTTLDGVTNLSGYLQVDCMIRADMWDRLQVDIS